MTVPSLAGALRRGRAGRRGRAPCCAGGSARPVPDGGGFPWTTFAINVSGSLRARAAARADGGAPPAGARRRAGAGRAGRLHHAVGVRRAGAGAARRRASRSPRRRTSSARWPPAWSRSLLAPSCSTAARPSSRPRRATSDRRCWWRSAPRSARRCGSRLAERLRLRPVPVGDLAGQRGRLVPARAARSALRLDGDCAGAARHRLLRRRSRPTRRSRCRPIGLGRPARCGVRRRDDRGRGRGVRAGVLARVRRSRGRAAGASSMPKWWAISCTTVIRTSSTSSSSVSHMSSSGPRKMKIRSGSCTAEGAVALGERDAVVEPEQVVGLALGRLVLDQDDDVAHQARRARRGCRRGRGRPARRTAPASMSIGMSSLCRRRTSGGSGHSAGARAT